MLLLEALLGGVEVDEGAQVGGGHALLLAKVLGQVVLVPVVVQEERPAAAVGVHVAVDLEGLAGARLDVILAGAGAGAVFHDVAAVLRGVGLRAA